MNRPPYDEQQHAIAARITSDHPQWLVIWGDYSRAYWAYPAFSAPRGTILSHPAPRELAAAMRQTELATLPPTLEHLARQQTAARSQRYA